MVFHLLFKCSSCYNKISEDSLLVELESGGCVIFRGIYMHDEDCLYERVNEL